MATVAQELESFTQFARDRLGDEDASLSLDELFDLWRIENPSEMAYSDNVAAIAGAIEDFKNGDRGRPAGELSRELRQQLGIPQPIRGLAKADREAGADEVIVGGIVQTFAGADV